jgi:hypothetical protein
MRTPTTLVPLAIAAPLGLAAVLAVTSGATPAAAARSSITTVDGLPRLEAATERAWSTLVARVERQWRAAVRRPAGPADEDVVVEPGWPLDDTDPDAAVPDALAHRWRGRVLIRGISLDTLLDHLRSDPPGTNQADVLASAILERADPALRVFLRVRRSRIVTAVFDTEHEVRIDRHGHDLATSQSVATRIVEVERAGSPDERVRPPDENRGLLWRWRAYWRYVQRAGGVLAECESLTLSRRVPVLMRPVAGPIIDGVARESMERTLTALRDRYGRRMPHASSPAR